MKNLILVNPQWQGGGDIITYNGAKEFEKLYLNGKEYTTAPVSTETKLGIRNNIIGYDVLYSQMKSALDILKNSEAERVFAVGGGCDADVPIIAYLNRHYDGKLFVIWCDAHGDLNSPEDSQTGLFYGMPARVLLDGDKRFLQIIEKPLEKEQFIHIGGRDLDAPEERFIQDNNIFRLPHIGLKQLNDKLSLHKEWHIYIHLDLDVLSPEEFSDTPLPVPGGEYCADVLGLIQYVKNNCLFAGLGLYEYVPCKAENAFIRSVTEAMTE